jgi:hypothetical protein
MNARRAINLLPRKRIDAYRGAARLRIWAVAAAIYIVLVSAVCVTGRMTWGQNLSPLRADAAATEQKVQTAEKVLSSARAQLRQALTRQSTVTQVLDHPDLAALIGITSRRLGEEVVLRDLHASMQNAPQPGNVHLAAAGFTDDRTFKLELRGLGKSAVSVGKFVSALEATKLFDRVVLLRTSREPFGMGDSAISFEIQCIAGERGQR